MRIVRETYWYARCGCGWVSNENDDAETMVNKTKTHLLAHHRQTECDIVITCRVASRKSDTLRQLNPHDEAQATLDAARRLADAGEPSPTRTPGDAP